MNDESEGMWKDLVLTDDLRWRLPEGAEEYHEKLSGEPTHLLRFEPSTS